MNSSEGAAVDPVTEEAIRLQLERILLSPSFRSSKRLSRFLRFVIDKTLSGTAQEIKERIIGAEVFDRDVHYDVSSDPIVRVAAGDIRKRLAQYYIQPGHEHELRIELPPGSYIATFSMPRGDSSAVDGNSRPDAVPHPSLISSDAPSRVDPPISAFDSLTSTVRAKRNRSLIVAVLAIGVLALGLVGTFVWSHRSTHSKDLDVFWHPLLNTNSGTILCIGDLNYLIEDQSPTLPRDINRVLAARDHVSAKDTFALARIEGFMGENSRYATVLLADNATLTDLRGQPAVMIGAFDNHWTGELLSNYRFQFVRDTANQKGSIRDTRGPARTWTIDIGSPPAAVHKDYALVSRIKSPITEQTELIIAGIGPGGTVAASEFVTNPHYFSEFVKLAPVGWENRELQIVITTDVIGERSAPPHVLAFDVR